jgi:hypothetical protein
MKSHAVAVAILVVLAAMFNRVTAQVSTGDLAIKHATLLGGREADLITAVATDANGSVYVTGFTSSPDFPELGVQFGTGGFYFQDVFVSKFDPTLSRLEYSVKIGGRDHDTPIDLAVDRAGAVYVVGTTMSADFPVTSVTGPPPTAGIQDGFLVRLDPRGQLDYSTTFGGSSPDYAQRVVVDCAGHVYVAGSTGSEDFPADNRDQIVPGGNRIFLMRFKSNTVEHAGSRLLGDGEAEALACDSAGHAYLSGYTYGTIPGLTGFQPQRGGDIDAFVARTDAAGERVISGTYLGGVSYDRARDLKLGSDGSVHVVGSTSSTDFPVTGTSPRYQPTNGLDGFAAKLTPAGELVYSTVFSTSINDEAWTLDVDDHGRTWIGTLTSPQAPSILLVDSGGVLRRRWQTPLLATNLHQTLSIALGRSGDLWVAGIADVMNFPATAGAFQPQLGGGIDGFVMNVVAADSPVRVAPVADAYVRAGSWATHNFGASRRLLVKKGNTADFTKRTYLKFDITGVSAVSNASLRLHGRVANATTARVRMAVHPVSTAWSEPTVTWNTKPGYGAMLGTLTVKGTTPQWVELDVTPYVQAARRAGRTDISLTLRALEHTSADAVFESREDEIYAPQLVITATK